MDFEMFAKGQGSKPSSALDEECGGSFVFCAFNFQAARIMFYSGGTKPLLCKPTTQKGSPGVSGLSAAATDLEQRRPRQVGR